MEADPGRIRAAALPWWGRLLALLVAIITTGVLVVGWGAGVDQAVRIWPGLAAMVPSTALLFAVNSLALVYPRNRAGRAQIIRAAALFSLAVALINLALILLGIADGIDAFLGSAVGLGDLGEDRMALATSLCFLLLAISLLTLLGNGRQEAIFVGTATGGLLLSLAALVGYIFGVSALYAVSLFTAMALLTSLSFVILFTVVLFARSDRGWVRTFTGPGEGSAGARRLIPLVIGVPLLLCFLVLLGMRADFYETDFGLSLLGILIVILLFVSVLRNAHIQNEMQQQLTMRLQQLTEDNETLLQEVYHRVKNNLQQIKALIMLEAPLLPKNQRDVLHALSDRIGALAGVHKLLLSSPSVLTLDPLPFLEDLCNGIIHGSGAERRNITCVVEADSRPVKVDLAIPIGLLVNELVTNALKHAFVGREAGTVRVSLKTADEGSLRLIVRDDGCGMEDQRETRDDRAGKRIVHGLVRQLGGSMRISTDRGTIVEVTIPPEARTEHG